MSKTPKFQNVDKQAYADRFLAWVRSGEKGPEPDHPGLKGMAAQSVRAAVYTWANDNGIRFHA